ncbi:hypothetical protein R3P38DRAFT_3280853 [Favolaschia claudopus]|uniref:Uncharacterized protein n=1 Tax=Favolaschia claudopus TaxID=2862362 RepID=A0AAW0AG07_9AGAR
MSDCRLLSYKRWVMPPVWGSRLLLHLSAGGVGLSKNLRHTAALTPLQHDNKSARDRRPGDCAVRVYPFKSNWQPYTYLVLHTRSVPLEPCGGDPKALNPTSIHPFRVHLGTIYGVVPGTKFFAYFQASYSAPLRPKACLLGTVSSSATPSPLSTFPAGVAPTNSSQPTSRTRNHSSRHRRSDTGDAQIALRIDADEGVESSDALSSHQRRRGVGHRHHRRYRAAHCNYSLECANHADRIHSTLEVRRLKGEYHLRVPDTNELADGNMVIDGAYGFAIRISSDEELFPYLFYFDPETFTIQKWYAPGGRRVRPPLLPGMMVAIGMGGEPALEFALNPGQPSSAGVLKLFVTQEYVDLDWISRTFPFDLKYQGTGRETTENEAFDKMSTWDALTVALTMTLSLWRIPLLLLLPSARGRRGR